MQKIRFIHKQEKVDYNNLWGQENSFKCAHS